MNGIAVTGLDVRVELLLSGDRSPELADRITTAWSRCLELPASRSAEPVSLTLDGVGGAEEVARGSTALSSGDLDILLNRATQSVTAAIIGAQAGNLLMFHAGAVSHPDSGASLVFVAPGGTGKTTLARVLGRRFGYLTDETVGIDRDGRILPYPKPLSIRAETHDAHKHELSPDQLGLQTGHSEPRVARIILLERDDHLEAPAIEELPLLDAITALAPETSSLSSLDRGLSFCADLIESTGPVLRVRYAEARALVGLADDLIGGK